MSETEDEGEASIHLDDERKLMRSVLSQFDNGAATTSRHIAKQQLGFDPQHHSLRQLVKFQLGAQLAPGVWSRQQLQ